MTIAFVTAIASLIAITMGLLRHDFTQTAQKNFLAQGDLMSADMFALLKNVTADVNDSQTLDIFLALPFAFENAKTQIAVGATFESGATRPNVNWLVEHNVSSDDPYAPLPLNAAMEEYLEHILTVYNVSDKMLLVSMMADTIDEDLNERLGGSEIALESIDFMQGGVYDFGHFKQILHAYERQTQDFSVEQIPWKYLLGYTNDTLDLNYVTPDALHYLLPDMAEEEIVRLTTEREAVFDSYDAFGVDEVQRKRLEAVRSRFYAPEVAGDLLIRRGDERLHVGFLFDLGKKEVRHIEVSR